MLTEVLYGLQAGIQAWCCAVQVETSEVCIPDFDYDTISWMLRYMYGCLELTPQHLSHPRVSASHPAVLALHKLTIVQRY